MRVQWAVPVIVSILILGGLGLSHQAVAVITPITTFNNPQCDPLIFAVDSDEIGTGVFPANELVLGGHSGSTGAPSCISSNQPDTDFAIEITNTVSPPRSFDNLHYVADLDTSISNFDGLINGALAFRIDNAFSPGGCGVNCPLFFESIAFDGVFEPGETWHFTVQDFSNPLFSAAHVGSIGVPSGPQGDTSSGSIIEVFPDFFFVGGTEIPIDTTPLLLAGVQSVSMWMIPVVLAGIGIGIFVIKRRN